MRVIKTPEDRKTSITFSLPLYLISWLETMKQESPNFDKNKLLIDTFNEYRKKRGDLNEKESD